MEVFVKLNANIMAKHQATIKAIKRKVKFFLDQKTTEVCTRKVDRR